MSEKLEMRELNGGDIFTMLSIIGKLDIKEEVVSLIERQYGAGKDVIPLADHKKKKPTKKEQEVANTEYQKRGMVLVTDIGFAILRHVNDAKADVNKFLADLTGTSQKEIESLSMLDYSKLLIDFGKKAELKDFFQSIASLLG
ncbi:hypothetical protein JNG37_08200 [Streptococcus suis]|uniref:Uncharacterized protein n=1 Tax=Streptococcus suis TaxID=1307 RepID=A0A4T2GHV6_STRSU|nr:hypothetical protein [Streptococcus suis]MBM7270683.1 hypothetical protein [Streptococcus suis]NQN86618.1 hypothetical protein [Streptococcus suis]TIH98169.1 hypothetical protein FAJ39_10295 [Streptococcus suis]